MSDGKYAFEKSKIIQGDCLEKMKLIPDKSIDFICCDLPYGSTANKWDNALPNELLWEQYKRIIKDDGAIALFGTGLFAYKLALSNEKMYKYEIIWHKSKSGSSFTAKYRPVSKHENILIFGKGRVKYNPQLEEGEPYYRKRKENKGDKPNNHKLGVVSESETKNDGFRYPGTVQFFQQKWRRQDQVHPTQKPVPLLQWLVRSFTNEGDIVLDNTAGSGSLGLACIEEKRDFILIEKDPNYYEVIKERVGEIFKNYGLNLQTLLDEHNSSIVERGAIRVKYLDREDIEALGFIYIKSQPGLTEDYFELVSTEWCMDYDYSTQYCRIFINSDGDSTFFAGTIKNKSELKIVLKMLNILK